MGSSSMLSLLLSLVSVSALSMEPEWSSRWQACRGEASPLIRLACYDGLGQIASPMTGNNDEQRVEPGSVSSNSKPRFLVSRSATWLAIDKQERGRMSDSPSFLLWSDPEQQEMTLTRPALGATLAVGCSHSITQLRFRLDSPWQDEQVRSLLDGHLSPMALDANWFIRDEGYLLEYGRGLPAIDELKRWAIHGELQLLDEKGQRIRVVLDGLEQALQPLRQLCRW